MSHPFGDLIAHHLHRKHGLSQSKLAAGILQAPSVITDMCQGKRLHGRQARERVVAILAWLHRQGVLETADEANAVLSAAGMAPLHAGQPSEAAVLQQLDAEPATYPRFTLISLPPTVPALLPILDGRAAKVARHNLPAQTTPLLGRAYELAQLAHLLADPATRLVTILSAGGMGKTHLGIAAALNQVEHFSSGVCWAALAPLTDVQELVPAVGAALGLHFQAGNTPEQQVCDFLRAKHLLLVLDNFEHLLEGATFVSRLLEEAPRLSILVTSRQRLKLSSETVFLLGSLRFPGPQSADALDYPAVQMFVEHARHQQPNYQPNARDVAGIVEVCRLVDGMPLGIVLAAAWSGIMSPSAIAAEIGKDLGFLHTDLLDIPARQRNLRAVFLRTWNRLSAAERANFMRLSVFRGGATRGAAQSITRATMAVLASLNDKALLWRRADDRYEVHELLRQFAAEQLALADASQGEGQEEARRAHSRYYLALLAEQEEPLQGPQQRAALDIIRADVENISVAWHWAAQRHEFALLAPAIHALFVFCDAAGGYRTGVTLFGQASAELRSAMADRVADLSILRSIQGQTLIRLGGCEVMLSDFTEGERHLHDGLSSVTVDQERALALLFLSIAAADRGDVPLAHRHAQESLALSQRCNDWAGMADALHRLQEASSNFVEACRRLAESLALWRRVGRPDRIASLLGILAWDEWCIGHYSAAEAHWREGLALCEQLDLLNEKAWVIDNLGYAAWSRGEMATAEDRLQEALGIYTAVGRRAMMGMCKAELSLVFANTGRVEQAIALAQEAVTITREVDSQINLTLSLTCLGAASIVAGDLAAARRALLEAVQRAWEHRYYFLLMMAFYYVAELLWLQSRAARLLADALDAQALALAVLSCVRTHSASWQFHKDRATQLQAEMEDALPDELRVAAITRERSSTLEEMVSASLEAMDTR